MFEQLQTWFRDRKGRQICSPRPRTILELESLEERWCPAGDIYTWNPGLVNNLASNPANWEKNGAAQGAGGTLPGNNANDTAILDGDKAGNIEWDQKFTFSTMTFQNGFVNTQAIDKNITVDLTGANGNGSLKATETSDLAVKFADVTGTLQIDKNASINTFSISGGGTLLIDGGTTTILGATESSISKATVTLP